MTTVLVLLFLIVMAAVTMAGLWWNSRQTVPAVFAAVIREPAAAQQQVPTMATALEWVGDRRPANAGNSLRRLLSYAGYRAASAISIFQGIKYVATIALAGFGIVVSLATGGDALLSAGALGALGFLAPDRIVKFLAERRRKRLRNALPAAMDLLVLSIEAGQSLDTALMETARGIRNTYPELAQELNTLTGDLRANTSRTDSLRLFHERTGEPELKKVAALLTDTDRFGTSLGPAMRNHSRYLRQRARQKAQETARKVGVKLIFPVFFLIFPSVILVTLGPAVIMVSRQMKVYMSL
jgi:tight adherence protein C